MLNELCSNFSFSQLEANHAQHAFSIWLQTSLNLPLSTHDPLLDQACAALKVEYERLVEFAVALDMNIAFLNRMLRAYALEEIRVPKYSIEPESK